MGNYYSIKFSVIFGAYFACCAFMLAIDVMNEKNNASYKAGHNFTSHFYWVTCTLGDSEMIDWLWCSNNYYDFTLIHFICFNLSKNKKWQKASSFLCHLI
jgi:hypothetical protein